MPVTLNINLSDATLKLSYLKSPKFTRMMHLNHFSRNIRQSRFKNLHPSLNFKHSISVRICLVTKLIKSLTELGNNFSHSVDISVNLFFHNFVFDHRTINFTSIIIHFYGSFAALRADYGKIYFVILPALADISRSLARAVPSLSSSRPDILRLALLWKS